MTNEDRRILTVPLPDPVAKNIEAIATLQKEQFQNLPPHQQLLENAATFFGTPSFLYVLLMILVLWIFSGTLHNMGLLPFEIPTFAWADQGLDVASLLISTGVLIRQTRQENFAEQRSQLALQLDLLSEQKIAKIIALLEELRTDMPDVNNRHDPEAAVMQEPADPLEVLEALRENVEEELASQEK